MYRAQGALVFIVYDPAGAITDAEKFVAAYETHEGIWVGTARIGNERWRGHAQVSQGRAKNVRRYGCSAGRRNS